MQHADCFPHGAGIGVRPEKAAFAVHAPAVVTHPREGVCGNSQIRITLVVPKENVVLGIEGFDEVVFQQKRFGFASHNGCLKGCYLLHHDGDARAEVIFLKVRGDAAL